MRVGPGDGNPPRSSPASGGGLVIERRSAGGTARVEALRRFSRRASSRTRGASACRERTCRTCTAATSPATLPRPRRRRRRREELRGRGGPRPVPARRAGDDGRARLAISGARQVLDQTGPGEPHPRRRDRAFFHARVAEIEPGSGPDRDAGGGRSVPAEAVFPLIGYEPDFALFERCGIGLEGAGRVPAHDRETLESNVPKLYLAGAILGGTDDRARSSSRTAGTTRRIASAIAGRSRRRSPS